MRAAFERRRDLIVSLAKEIPGWVVNKPQGAFYLFPQVESLIGKKHGEREIKSSGDYVMYLLEETMWPVLTAKPSAPPATCA